MRIQHLLPLSMAVTLAACTSDPECGDGKADADEYCDGSDLGGMTCADYGFTAGTLGCDSQCVHDLSGCQADPCAFYPCETFGTAPGDVVANLTFDVGNAAASVLSGGAPELTFADIYAQSVTNGGALTAMLLVAVTGWCPYCGEEALALEGMYRDLQDQGVLVLGVLTEDNRGDPADAAYAAAYGNGQGWTFPAVAGDIPIQYWTPDDDAGSVPLHVFFDLRNMRIYGRFTGAAGMKMLRYPLEEIAGAPAWNAQGEREVSFDCAPGTGTETEPNGLDTPEDGSTLPYSLSGVLCPPTVAEGLSLEEDDVDLGVLAAGTVIDVSMTADTGSGVYPFFLLLRLDAAEQEVEWYQYGPVTLGAASVRRQWLLDTGGHYFLSASDGRAFSTLFYGDATVPDEHACCDGGPQFTYGLSAESATLAATQAALSVGATVDGSVDAEQLQVYPLAVTAGTSYTIELTAASADTMDAYLILYDPATAAVLAFNDDIDSAGGVYDSKIVWEAEADTTVWVVPSYWFAVFEGSAPAYQLKVQ